MFYLKAKLVKNIGWLKYFSANIAGVDQDLCIKYATGAFLSFGGWQLVSWLIG